MLIVSLGIYLDHIGSFTAMYFCQQSIQYFSTPDTEVSHADKIAYRLCWWI